MEDKAPVSTSATMAKATMTVHQSSVILFFMARMVRAPLLVVNGRGPKQLSKGPKQRILNSVRAAR